jgi:hypothetical protein
VNALTLRPEQGQHLGGLEPAAAEPVRGAGVELSRLARLHDEVVLAEPQPQPAGQHVHPLITLVALLLALGLARRDDHLVGTDPARLAGQRDHGAAIAPHRPGPDARVTGFRRAHEFVQRHLIGAGQGQQQLQGRLATAALQPGQRAHRDAGRLGKLGQRAAAAAAQRSQPRPDRVQDRIVLHSPICCFSKRICQIGACRIMVGAWMRSMT